MRRAALLNWLTYRAVCRNRSRSEKPRWRVGIYKGDRLGDFVLSIGAIRSIIDRVGAGDCVLFHGPAPSALAARIFPDVARIQLPEPDGKLWVTRRRMRDSGIRALTGGGVQQLISLRHFRSLADEVAIQMIPAKEVWCVSNSDMFSVDYEVIRERFDGDVVVERPPLGNDAWTCEDLACHQRLLRAWSAEAGGFDDVRPRLVRSSARTRTLALAPFGSSRIRDLPLSGVAACAIFARRSLRLEPVLLVPPGGAKQYGDYAACLAKMNAPVALKATPTLNDLTDCLSSCSALLTTETATAHMATALDLPMVCVVGGGHYGLFSPWKLSARQAWLTHKVPCFNCNWQCSQAEPYCITDVGPRQMVEALERVVLS